MGDPYSRPSGALQNTFASDDPAFIQQQETDLARSRLREINEGQGPKGDFGKDHLKAIHHHIFQDSYSWAGHTRNETFTADGHDYTPVDISKGDTRFLTHSRIGTGLDIALEPIAEPSALKEPEAFAERAGAVLGELNYVHLFGRAMGERNVLLFLSWRASTVTRWILQ